MVRAQVLPGVPAVGGHIADVRVGHMEAKAVVPVNGIPCQPPSTTTGPSTTAGPTTTTGPPATPPCTGFATGTDVHADLIQTGPLGNGLQVANAEVAFSGASVRTSGASPQLVNEMSQEVQPALPAADPLLTGSLAYGRGSALDIGLGNNVPVTGPTIPIPDLTRVSAPPNHGLQTAELGTVPGAPLVYASLLRGQANATTDGTTPLQHATGFGLGYAADVQLLDTGSTKPDGQLGLPVLTTDSTDPNRAVSQSTSTSSLTDFLSGGVLDHKGVTSEVRETIAPVTLFKGTAMQTTIEVLGEWVLTVTAGGKPGEASIHYGPDPATTPPPPRSSG